MAHFGQSDDFRRATPTCISVNGLLSMSGWEPFLAVASSKRMYII